MTLAVSTFHYHPDTGTVVDDPYPVAPGADMAGLEKDREALWSSSAVLDRGAKYLPRLKESDLWIDRAELDEFEAEVRLLHRHVTEIARELDQRPERLEHYLNNFLVAVRRARQQGGGVVIS